MKKNIKLLATLAAQEKTISKVVENFIFNLNRHDLKIFLNSYKNALQKNRAYITSASELSKESMNELNDLFKNKQIITVIDPSVIAGIKVIQADNIIDFTFKRYITDTIEMLK